MDTIAITLYNDIDEYLDDDLDENLTKKAILQALSEHDGELNFDLNELVFENYAARLVNQNSFTSFVNYIEAKNIGYFFVIKPLTDQVHVIYCRLD